MTPSQHLINLLDSLLALGGGSATLFAVSVPDLVVIAWVEAHRTIGNRLRCEVQAERIWIYRGEVPLIAIERLAAERSVAA